VTLSAEPAVGSTFAGWSGDCSGNSLSTAVTLSTGRSCTALFGTDPGSTLLQDGFEP
jgi:hypothetical protein